LIFGTNRVSALIRGQRHHRERDDDEENERRRFLVDGELDDAEQRLCCEQGKSHPTRARGVVDAERHRRT